MKPRWDMEWKEFTSLLVIILGVALVSYFSLKKSITTPPPSIVPDPIQIKPAREAPVVCIATNALVLRSGPERVVALVVVSEDNWPFISYNWTNRHPDRTVTIESIYVEAP